MNLDTKCTGIVERENALKSGKKTQHDCSFKQGSTFEDYCDTEVFNGWFEQLLAPIWTNGNFG